MEIALRVHVLIALWVTLTVTHVVKYMIVMRPASDRLTYVPLARWAHSMGP